MSLLLNAEQRSLLNLFTRREQYVIPLYQRPYSWGIDQCQKLYDDIIMGFNDSTDYFLGNIILAVSDKTKQEPRVVDGQQRLITLWLMFKVLSELLPNVKVLSDTLCTYNWDGSCSQIKLMSNIFEANDDTTLEKIYKWTRKDYEDNLQRYTKQEKIAYQLIGSNLIANSLFFYSKYTEFLNGYGEENLLDFLRYVLEKVFILPIELNGSSQEEAEDKALTIFETVNNRGMNLSDADIFKAKLYNKTITKEEKEEFIKLWIEVKEECEFLNLSIDDLFRYYSHIVRGLRGNTKNEISLREFFSGSNSVISQKGYKEVMKDLLLITNLLTQYNEKKKERTELAAWFQLIDIYSNIYPKYAVVTYLYHNNFENTDRLLTVLKTIVRYCYYMGSTSNVKFGIYNIVYQISQNLPLDNYYRQDVPLETFSYMGRLKYGFALLAHYLEEPEGLPFFETDRLLSTKDSNTLTPDWAGHDLEEHLDDLGNLVIIDTYKRSKSYKEKNLDYRNTKIKELRNFLLTNPDALSYNALTKRDLYKKNLLINFFSKP